MILQRYGFFLRWEMCDVRCETIRHKTFSVGLGIFSVVLRVISFVTLRDTEKTQRFTEVFFQLLNYSIIQSFSYSVIQLLSTLNFPMIL